MSKIKDGFDGKTTEIRVYAGAERDVAEVWIIQDGLKLPEKYGTLKETLAYATINELIQLRDELNEAIGELAGTKQ